MSGSGCVVGRHANLRTEGAAAAAPAPAAPAVSAPHALLTDMHAALQRQESLRAPHTLLTGAQHNVPGPASCYNDDAGGPWPSAVTKAASYPFVACTFASPPTAPQPQPHVPGSARPAARRCRTARSRGGRPTWRRCPRRSRPGGGGGWGGGSVRVWDCAGREAHTGGRIRFAAHTPRRQLACPCLPLQPTFP